MIPIRANIYTYGMNLYYGSLRGAPLLWVDLGWLARLLLPGHPSAYSHVGGYWAPGR